MLKYSRNSDWRFQIFLPCAMNVTTSEIQNPKSEIQNPKSEIRNPKSIYLCPNKFDLTLVFLVLYSTN